MNLTTRGVLLGLIGAVRFVFNLAASVYALVFLVLFALQFVHGAKIVHSAPVLWVHRFGDGQVRWTSAWFGMHWPSSRLNFIPLALAVLVWVLKGVIDGLLQRLDFRVRTAMKPPPKRVGLTSLEDDAAVIAAATTLNAESERHREVLLKRYREIEEALKTAGRKRCTFLSIDVVGSTQMKVGERETAIAATFQAYEELVRATFDSYSVWKQTWTPDGVMACFLDRELAVAAAQKVLTELPGFNKNKSQLRTPLLARAGLNEGDVSIFEDSALEKVADHVIDVAGHMQKHADPDTLLLSEPVFQALENKSGFVAAGRDVDGFSTYQWKPPAGEPI